MCISFRKSVDDDDDKSAANTNISIGCSTLFNELPDFNAMISEDFKVPQSDVLGLVFQYDSNILGGDNSSVSDDLSECKSLNEHRVLFLLKMVHVILRKDFPKY